MFNKRVAVTCVNNKKKKKEKNMHRILEGKQWNAHKDTAKETHVSPPEGQSGRVHLALNAELLVNRSVDGDLSAL